jgi:hypothetical protein
MNKYLGAYATEQDALDAKASRPEPQEELAVVFYDVDPDHPWCIQWFPPTTN